jgi:hypothetical protein
MAEASQSATPENGQSLVQEWLEEIGLPWNVRHEFSEQEIDVREASLVTLNMMNQRARTITCP